MNRAERRRQAKSKEKAVDKIVSPFRNTGIDMVSARIKAGNWYDVLDQMYRDDTQRLVDYTSDEMVSELAKAENYMMFGMLLICIQSIRLTFGNLKTVQNGMNKFLSNLTPALEYIDRRGLRESYDELRNLYGFDLEFEEYDINEIWEKTNKVNHIVWRVWEKRKPELDEFMRSIDDERQIQKMQACDISNG